MNIIRLLFIPIVIISLNSCSTTEKTKTDSASLTKLLGIESEIYSGNSKYIDKLIRKRIGKEGFFYLIGPEGKVKKHPVKALENMDLSKFPFYESMKNSDSGCTLFSATGKSFIIFYTKTSGNGILCLSIPETEIQGKVGNCTVFIK